MTLRSNGSMKVKFGDVVRNVTQALADPKSQGLDKTVGLDDLDPGSLAISRFGLVADGTTFTKRFGSGHVLFGKRRAYQRKVAVADFQGVCSGDILVFETWPKRMLQELLPFIAQSDGFFNHALRTSRGSLSPRTSWRDLATFEFELPPLDEQKRVAELLWSCYEAARRYGRMGLALRLLRQAHFDAALVDSVTATIALGQLMTRGPESGYSAPAAGRDTGHYVLALSAITPSGYLQGQLKPVDATAPVLDARLSTGDLLISRSNTLELVGYTAVFPEMRSDVSFPDTMMRLHVDERRVRREFVERTLASRIGRSHIRRVAAGTSASMKKINRAAVASLPFPLPSLVDQDRILNTQSAIARLEMLALEEVNRITHLLAVLRTAVFAT